MNEKEAKTVALQMLARRGYLSTELEKKLIEKGVSQALAQKVIAECKARGYLNDEERVAAVIAAEKRKGKGPHWIAAKLRSKGVSANLEEMQGDQHQEIRTFIQKRGQRYALDTREGKHKLFQALQRRGFEPHAILDVLKMEKDAL